MENDVYKYGVTKDMKDRNNDLKRMKYKSIYKIYKVRNNNIGCEVEKRIKEYVKKMEIHRHFNIYTRKVSMPYNNSIVENGKLTEFFIENTESLAMLEGQINGYIELETYKYNTKHEIEDKNELTKLQIMLAEATKDKKYNEEVIILDKQHNVYLSHIKLVELNIKSDDKKIELAKINLEIERLKYGGDKHYRDNPEKDILRKSRRNYKCINGNCKRLTHKDNKLCKYCSCKKRVLDSVKNGRPLYSKLKDDLSHMNRDQIGEKYKTTGRNVILWIKTYERYNLLD